MRFPATVTGKVDRMTRSRKSARDREREREARCQGSIVGMRNGAYLNSCQNDIIALVDRMKCRICHSILRRFFTVWGKKKILWGFQWEIEDFSLVCEILMGRVGVISLGKNSS